SFAARLLTLQTMKPGKALAIATALAEPLALSPDGTQFAGRVSSSATRTGVAVWSFATGKKVQQITIEDRRVNLALLDFAPQGRLVVMKDDRGKRVIQTWDVAKGTKVREWPGPAEYAADSAALSPGRKYLAAAD